ncbi:MAG: ParB-like nuclease domain protein [Parcubacteria group bacterium ADurb.Bin216]|nr:MAG: ParB-like nuclease domain protein [Parcubacteria group bacterium ADurb.Bin216]
MPIYSEKIMTKSQEELITKWFNEADDKIEFLNELRTFISSLSPQKSQPVDRILWVPVDIVQANDYNPNSVASIEMELLYVSISHDGYTQPIVTVYDKELGKYIIVDGFHRYFIAKTKADISKRINGRIPIVVIDKDITERMASTVRHNRARGEHMVTGMSNLVFQMLDNGMSEAEICQELGMQPEEVLKLKHITGFSKLFENAEYSKAWMTKYQIRQKAKMQQENKNE